MRITAVLFLAASLHVAAKTEGQNVTLKVRNTAMKEVFREIQRQTGLDVLVDEGLLEKAGAVTLDVKDMPVSDVLSICLRNEPLTYSISDGRIIVKPSLSPHDIHGRVTDSLGNPLVGASVMVRGTKKGTQTDGRGDFILKGIEDRPVLNISYTGYISRQVIWEGDETRTILQKSSSPLDAVVVIPYGTTTARLNTGDISTVTAKVLAEQPVANPLAALEGRVPGLIVTQSNGLPGAGFSVQIRGQNSILSGNEPLYLIDGVPYTNTSISTGVISANGQQSPFSSINPGDIESIEILKDADATAIYGSRGANGVVLITTKKGKIGKTKLDLNVYTGTGTITRMVNFLNTPDYIQMRKEALANDGLTPDIYNAPDLVAWDTTRYTDWKKLLVGGTSHTTDVQASVSGGNSQTQFLVGGSYHKESTVFPGDLSDDRIAMHFNISHSSLDNKFKLNLTGSYSYDKNNLIGQDLTSSITLSPNAPPVYDSAGKLNWSEGGAVFNNPLAYLLQTSNANTDYLNNNLVLSYEFLPGLLVRANLGYTTLHLQQEFLYPGASLNPAYNFTGFSEFGNSSFRSWIVEPQLNYIKAIGKWKLDVLLGTSFQEEKTVGDVIYASNFSSDALLGSPSAAGSVFATNTYNLYRYQSVFGRINFDWDNKYILNLTGRRDGSSRFGPDRQFANFGAIGAAWIFSKESFAQDHLSFLSFGKLRASYGITGNDKIGDYQYLNTYSPVQYPYQGQVGLVPTQLYNPDYSWETNKKFEAGLELGFVKDRIIFITSYYLDRSSNQLINYTLPIQTGFIGVNENLPALVQNNGWEFQLNASVIKAKDFTWDVSVNLTIPRNKLLEFPNLATSSYASSYEIGKPLNIVKLIHTTGVDPQTGIYQFADSKGVNTAYPVFPDDYTVVKDLTPVYYGGFSNRFQYKQFSLSVFFQFVKQDGYNYRHGNVTPGAEQNQPVYVLNRWQKPGDITDNQRYSTTDPASTAYYYYSSASDAIVSDASFIRLKNVSFSYVLPTQWSHQIKSDLIRIYLQGQNLITITNYQGSDPETRSMASLPPLKMITAGIQITF